MQSLEGLEHFSLDGTEYEAFNTSGGLGTLCETLAGKVETLDYKSVRYPGHRELMKFLLDDLRMSSDRDGLKVMLRRAVPVTAQDVVLVFVTATGMCDGRLVQDVFTRKIFAKNVCGVEMSAIQITTAGAICAELDLFREGVLPQSGFIRQEQVPLEAFLANRFGPLYEGDEHAGCCPATPGGLTLLGWLFVRERHIDKLLAISIHQRRRRNAMQDYRRRESRTNW